MTAFVDEHRGRFGVEPICRALGVSASAYYARRSGRRSARATDDERVIARIRSVHAENGEAYGYRRTWKALRRAGEVCGRRQVQRLMAAHGIVGATRRGRRQVTTVADPAAVRPADLVERDFTADRPAWPAAVSSCPSQPPFMERCDDRLNSPWSRAYTPCNESYPRAVQCDEFPNWATIEGGPGASLKLIDGRQNQSEGGNFRHFLRQDRCLFSPALAKGEAFLVVPMPEATRTTWTCR